MPSVFARLTRGAKPVPYVSVFLYAGLVLALIVIPGIWLKAIDVFAYEATIGTVLVVLVYVLTNLALPLFFWKKRRAEFSLFKHLLVPVVGIRALFCFSYADEICQSLRVDYQGAVERVWAARSCLTAEYPSTTKSSRTAGQHIQTTLVL